MNKFLIATAALASVALVAPANAADLPVKAPPIVMPALYNWNGIYIGVEGGAIMGQNSDWIAEPDAFNHFCSGSVWGGACQNVGHPMHGGFVGGEAGWNWQAPGSRWVFGIEGDGQWAELEEALTCAVPLNTSDGLGKEFSCGSRIHDFESVRGRIGYAFGPRGDFLVYVTGGWLTANQSVLVKTLFTPFASEEQSHRVNGFQVGGGAEYGITPWLSLKGEILYSWLESHTFCSPATNLAPLPPAGFHSVTPCGPLVNESVKIHDDFVLARMGLNWRFWWGKGAPVVASY
jgi:outer membrane immunogenic protein